MQMLVLFLLGLASGVHGTCECQYTSQTYLQPPLFSATLWIMNAADDSTNEACPHNCTIYLNSGDPTKGIGKYYQHVWDSSATGTIDIYNADENGTILSPFKTGINQSVQSFSDFSTSPHVAVVINTAGSGSVIASMEIGPKSDQVTTTTPATTTPYSGPGINPALISHDLLIMVDTGKNSPYTAADMADSQTFAAAVVDNIAPSVFTQSETNDQTPFTGTRLTLNALYYLGSSPFLPPWDSNATSVSSLIKSLPTVITQKTNFTASIEQFARTDSIFSPVNGSSKFQASRNTTQRTLFVVASSSPVENDITSLAAVDLTTFDIHPVFVAFNFDPLGNLTKLESSPSKWTVLQANKNTDVDAFVTQNFLSRGAGNSLCSSPAINNFTANSTNQTFGWPITYPSFERSTTPNYSQNRYCNFQKFSITINAAASGPTCFSVKHETEADKDTLKFYQQNGYQKMVEVVSLSGIDVDGIQFQLVNNTRIDFESNESQVFGGFQIDFKSCS